MQRIKPTSKYNFNFMKARKLAFTLSLFLIISVFYLFLTKGLNFGVDFTGGIVFEVTAENKEIGLENLRVKLNKKTRAEGLGDATIQKIGGDDLLIRVAIKDSEGIVKIIESLKLNITKILGKKTDFRKVDFVGPQVGDELIKGAVIALLLSFLGIIIYIWIRFDWQYGVGALLALLHDAAIVLGVYLLTNLEFNITSVAAILTVIGYSVNDSVVIYDRIRENLRKYKKLSLDEILNISINDTLSRTILTAGTTMVALLALIISGGEVIYGFSLACFIGVSIGTYSSIYVSAPILKFMRLQGISNKN